MAIKFKNLITSDSAGSGAIIKTAGDWSGTVVPRTGLIENVYLNTELSFDEVISILDGLTYTEINAATTILCHSIISDDSTAMGVPMGLGVVKQNGMTVLVAVIADAGGLIVLFADKTGSVFNCEITTIGWQTENIQNPLAININAVDTCTLASYTFPAGAENDKLISLVSNTPFTQAEDSIVLEGEYQGTSIDVTENQTLDIKSMIENKEIPLSVEVNVAGSGGGTGGVVIKGGIQVTAVPNSGTLSEIYFNTSLSVEEVIDEMDKVTWIPAQESIYMYSVLMDANMANAVLFMKDTSTNVYAIADIATQVIFFSFNQPYVTDGWSTDDMAEGVIDATGKYKFNSVLTLTAQGQLGEVGLENELISMLISATQFVASEDTLLEGEYDGNYVKITESDGLDVAELIDNKKIPLNIKLSLQEKTVTENGDVVPDEGYCGLSKVTVDAPLANLTIPSKYSGTEIPRTGTLDNIYFNKNLTVVEVVDLISQLDYEATYDGNGNALELKQYVIIGLTVDGNLKEYFIYKYNDDYVIGFSTVGGSGSYIFSTSETFYNSSNIGFTGWSSELEYPYVENRSIFIGSDDALQNDLISSLVSTTEFVLDSAGEEKQLAGEYIGKVINVFSEGEYDFTDNINNKQIPFKIKVNTTDEIMTTVAKQTFTELKCNTDSIADYAFWYNSSLTMVFCPLATTIGTNSFANCSKLESIDFPLVTTVSGGVFSKCALLKNVNMPSLNKMENGSGSVFSGCTSLVSIDLPNFEYGTDYMFTGCTALEEAKLEKAKSLGAQIFADCTKLKNITLPSAETMHDPGTGSGKKGVFTNCTSIENVVLPLVNKCTSYAFDGCTSLATVKMPLAQSIAYYAFRNCTSLTDIYLGYEGMTTLNSIVAFEKVTGVTVHVRADYVDQYTANANWASLINDSTFTIVGDYTD